VNFEQLIPYIEQFGLIAILVIITLEYACFPIPSEVVLPFSGYVTSQGNINFVLLLIVSIVAGIVGSMICYAIGYFGGNPIIDTLIGKFPKWEKGLRASKGWFDKRGTVAVMLGRVVPLMRTYISFVSGIARQNPLTFILFSGIGIAVWNFILVGAGYLLGENFHLVAGYIKEYAYIIAPLVAIGGGIYIWKLWKKSKAENSK